MFKTRSKRRQQNRVFGTQAIAVDNSKDAAHALLVHPSRPLLRSPRICLTGTGIGKIAISCSLLGPRNSAIHVHAKRTIRPSVSYKEIPVSDAEIVHGTSQIHSCDVRLTLVGPLPPPINGQSVVMNYMSQRLSPHFPRLSIADSSGDESLPWRRTFTALRQAIVAWRLTLKSDSVYLAVKAGRGMWLTAMTAGLARLVGAEIFLHHHSYAYVRMRKLRMVALTRVAGPTGHHIVLSRAMARDLAKAMPEIRTMLIIGNACLVDRGLLDLPLKNDEALMTLGHLGTLTLDKGIGEVVSLAIALHRAGARIRLVIGGPVTNREAQQHLYRAAIELGDRFEHRGTLAGAAKTEFFRDITHFIFPTRYVHEAVPLVLYEAMAAGAVCVTTRQGSIPEQLEGSPSVLADSQSSFVAEVLPQLLASRVKFVESHASRQAYLRALAQADRELGDFIALLARK